MHETAAAVGSVMEKCQASICWVYNLGWYETVEGYTAKTVEITQTFFFWVSAVLNHRDAQTDSPQTVCLFEFMKSNSSVLPVRRPRRQQKKHLLALGFSTWEIQAPIWLVNFFASQSKYFVLAVWSCCLCVPLCMFVHVLIWIWVLNWIYDALLSETPPSSWLTSTVGTGFGPAFISQPICTSHPLQKPL